MSDLGALLKKAREQRNLSLDDIQDLTKIRKRYLEAIEEGDYSVLPGSFYVRAFVKNYAESVGLDAEEVLRLYNKEIPSNVPEQVIEPVQRPRRRAQTQSSDRLSRWGFRALMWSFLLLIIVLVYIFAIKQPNKDNVDSADQTKMTDQTKPPATTPDKDTVKNGEGNTSSNGNASSTDTTTNQPPVDETPVQEPTPPPTPTTTLTLDRTSGTTDYYKVSPGGAHTIEMTATGRTWLGIYQKSRTGKMVLSVTLDLDKGPKSATYDADGPIFITFPHANAVEVTVDGVALDDGNKTGSHKFQLTPVEGTSNTGGTTDTNGTTDATTTQ
ncbi:helix-turn-helix domain-containing protein [Paenibacillus rhizovicinus]|uniref:Helix-turn-helix domain-containing protein n=1 Tax=Paenibacillus rhizovicinus TaxID=2704463 RepID=A0A6C0NWA5_9BACL|nr:helix-turn-helix domain-containing protein [Paenibacillus rhizovicinus]QHW30003.1 helix-turn-helix domain-containing protein [Paenibacillus rhizovicinus]